MVVRSDMEFHTAEDLQGRFITPHNVEPDDPNYWNRLLPPKSSRPTAKKSKLLRLKSITKHECVKNRTFESFQRLPLEIRLKIWRMTLPGPRVVPIQSYGIASFNIKEWDQTFQRRAFHSPIPPPITLHINRESRAEARRYYTLTFGCPSIGIPNSIWFNFKQDILYFGFDCPAEELLVGLTGVGWFTPMWWEIRNRKACLVLDERRPRCGIERVRRVVVSHRVIRHPRLWKGIVKTLRMWPELSEMDIAVERDDYAIPRMAMLEELDVEKDKEVEMLERHIERLRARWEDLFLSNEKRVPNLKLMEIRPRRQSGTVTSPSHLRRMKMRDTVRQKSLGMWHGVKLVYLMRRYVRQDILER